MAGVLTELWLPEARAHALFAALPSSIKCITYDCGATVQVPRDVPSDPHKGCRVTANGAPNQLVQLVRMLLQQDQGDAVLASLEDPAAKQWHYLSLTSAGEEMGPYSAQQLQKWSRSTLATPIPKHYAIKHSASGLWMPLWLLMRLVPVPVAPPQQPPALQQQPKQQQQQQQQQGGDVDMTEATEAQGVVAQLRHSSSYKAELISDAMDIDQQQPQEQQNGLLDEDWRLGLPEASLLTSTAAAEPMESTPGERPAPAARLLLVVDTNVLLSSRGLALLDALRLGDVVGSALAVQAVLPWAVLKELDRIKDSRSGAPSSVSERARAAVRHIHEHTKRGRQPGATATEDAGFAAASSVPFWSMQSQRDYQQAAKEHDFRLPDEYESIPGDDHILQCCLLLQGRLASQRAATSAAAATARERERGSGDAGDAMVAEGPGEDGSDEAGDAAAVLLLSNDRNFANKARAMDVETAELLDLPQGLALPEALAQLSGFPKAAVTRISAERAALEAHQRQRQQHMEEQQRQLQQQQQAEQQQSLMQQAGDGKQGTPLTMQFMQQQMQQQLAHTQQLAQQLLSQQAGQQQLDPSQQAQLQQLVQQQAAQQMAQQQLQQHIAARQQNLMQQNLTQQPLMQQQQPQLQRRSNESAASAIMAAASAGLRSAGSGSAGQPLLLQQQPQQPQQQQQQVTPDRVAQLLAEMASLNAGGAKAGQPMQPQQASSFGVPPLLRVGSAASQGELMRGGSAYSPLSSNGLNASPSGRLCGGSGGGSCQDAACEVLEQMRVVLCPLVEAVFQEIYEESWEDVLSVKPPWRSPGQLLELLKKHWRSVFEERMGRQLQPVVEALATAARRLERSSSQQHMGPADLQDIISKADQLTRAFTGSNPVRSPAVAAAIAAVAGVAGPSGIVRTGSDLMLQQREGRMAGGEGRALGRTGSEGTTGMASAQWRLQQQQQQQQQQQRQQRQQAPTGALASADDSDDDYGYGSSSHSAASQHRSSQQRGGGRAGAGTRSAPGGMPGRVAGQRGLAGTGLPGSASAQAGGQRWWHSAGGGDGPPGAAPMSAARSSPSAAAAMAAAAAGAAGVAGPAGLGMVRPSLMPPGVSALTPQQQVLVAAAVSHGIPVSAESIAALANAPAQPLHMAGVVSSPQRSTQAPSASTPTAALSQSMLLRPGANAAGSIPGAHASLARQGSTSSSTSSACPSLTELLNEARQLLLGFLEACQRLSEAQVDDPAAVRASVKGVAGQVAMPLQHVQQVLLQLSAAAGAAPPGDTSAAAPVQLLLELARRLLELCNKCTSLVMDSSFDATQVERQVLDNMPGFMASAVGSYKESLGSSIVYFGQALTQLQRFM